MGSGYEMVKSLYRDPTGGPLLLTPTQEELFDELITRRHPRLQVETYTRFGKSETASVALLTLASNFAEEFTIVAPTLPKAKIIMGYIIGHIWDNEYTTQTFQIGKDESRERIRRERSKTRLTFKVPGKGIGAINILSGDAKRRGVEAGDTLMGFGAPNVILDEAALLDDTVFAKILRMIGGHKNGWLCKLGNPFRRNHFFKSHNDPSYYKIFADYQRGLEEGRLDEDLIREARTLPFFDVLYEVKFPQEDTIDEGNYLPLLLEEQLEAAFRRGDEVEERGERRMGLDPAKGGCENVFTVRTQNVAYIAAANRETDIMKTGEKVLELVRDKAISPARVTLDAIGLGESINTQCKLLGCPITPVYVGDPSPDPRFSNLKAYAYWQMREWIIGGGALKRDPRLYQLLEIRYREEADKRVSIEPKERLRTRGIASPDAADSLMLTFIPLDLPAATGRSKYQKSPLGKFYPDLNA